jgi:hypothetical protein
VSTHVNVITGSGSTTYQVGSGFRGPQGIQGNTGETGATGAQGDRAGLKYRFDTSTNPGAPSPGHLKFNSSTLSAVTRIAIRDTDFDGTSTSALLDLIDNSTSAIKARVVIRSNSNSDTSHFNFLVTSVTDEGNHHHINGTYVSGSAFDSNEIVAFDFFVTGDKGDTGQTGPAGPDAVTGKTIYVDTNGTDTRGSLSQYSISVPFATIGAAMAASESGDTVRVRAGSYTITSTISLNGKGYLHLEEGVVVTCSVSGPVFSLTANESKSISGGGQFFITGSTTIFWVQSGGGLQTQLCSVQCAVINTTTSPLNAATIFDVSTGVLVVNAETVYALASTIISCAGTSSNLHYAVKFTYCSRFAHFPTSGSQAQMSCNCWTIVCYGTKCFQIVGGTVGAKYESLIDNSNNCTFFSLEYGTDSSANSLVIKGGRAITYSTNPCIRFTTTTGTNKYVRLIGDPFFYTAGVNSITAASARTVFSSFASSNKVVNGGVTITGTYSVNAGFIA